MTSDAVLDGNVLAGDLREVFAFEATTSMTTCAGCGNRAPLATWMVFVNAPGMVARCANCDLVQLRIVHDERGRTWVDLSGIASLELTS
jgi:hypothetical protein